MKHHAKRGEYAGRGSRTDGIVIGQIAELRNREGLFAISYTAVLAGGAACDRWDMATRFPLRSAAGSDAGTLTITHNGSTSAAVVGGTTTFADGDTLAWSPSAAMGKRYAFMRAGERWDTGGAASGRALCDCRKILPKVTASATGPFASEALTGKGSGEYANGDRDGAGRFEFDAGVQGGHARGEGEHHRQLADCESGNGRRSEFEQPGRLSSRVRVMERRP